MWEGILAAQMWVGRAEAAILLMGHRESLKAGVPVGRRDAHCEDYSVSLVGHPTYPEVGPRDVLCSEDSFILNDND